MTRYVVRPRAAGWDTFSDWSRADARRDGIVVHEPRQDGPAETGLYDQHGNPLMRLPDEPRPIGFLHVYETVRR
jgi:hypothetical protein